MTLTPRGNHELPLQQEFERIYSLLEKPVAAFRSLLVFLSGERFVAQVFSGYVSKGAVAWTVCFGEAGYRASGVRVYAASADGTNPAISYAITVRNQTESTSATGSLSDWTSGLGHADVDLELGEGDELSVQMVGDAALEFSVNVRITPDSSILLSMDDYPAEFRTEED